jgi:hypothetical protein
MNSLPDGQQSINITKQLVLSCWVDFQERTNDEAKRLGQICTLSASRLRLQTVMQLTQHTGALPYGLMAR